MIKARIRYGDLATYMYVQADFEDSLAPTWGNTIRGHINLRDAVNGTIRYEDVARNKVYKLNPTTAILFVRARGWHLPEAHIEVDGEPATGCLVDFGFYFFHNHAVFRSKHGGHGPFFYLPKMQHSRCVHTFQCSIPPHNVLCWAQMYCYWVVSVSFDAS